MINKLYDKVVRFMKENYLWLLFYIVFITVMTYPLPYYIYTGGGVINVDDKIDIKEASDSKGSFNMCYVSEINATVTTYLLSYLMPGWDVVDKEDVVLASNETMHDVVVRNKIYLDQANQSAILTAFSNSNNYYEILENNLYVIYIEEDSETDLKIGDIILNIDGISVNNIDEIGDVLNNKNIGDKVNILVKNNNKEYYRYGVIKESNNKEYYRYGVIKESNNKKIIGIGIENILNYKTEPIVKFKFSNNESGPSGGLMLSLALYDKLVDKDITKGLKIAGTGTIDVNGNVGSIGGVKYKLKGAIKNKSDVFIVPNGDNYNECIKLQRKYNYDIKIIGVSTFEDAIKKLKNL